MVTVSQNKSENKSIVEVLEFCKVHSLPARVVGRWVWIEFPAKPPENTRKLLKEFGFRWSKRRGQWAHNCGRFSRPARNYKPWDKYQTVGLDEACQRLGVA